VLGDGKEVVVMAKIDRFEDLVAWQKARELVKEVYTITGTRQLSKDFGLRDQIQKAAVSIMANIAEGFERYRLAEFHQFLSVAKASCAELRSHFYVALDVGYLDQASFDNLQGTATESARLIGALRASLRKEK
jgi:four helix bundle protein